MTRTMPPELLSPEEREARAVWLRRQIGREWLRYAVLEGLLLGIPSFAVILAYVMDAISRSTFVVLLIVLAGAIAAFLFYWLLRRVNPLTRELEALERVTTT